MRRNKKNQFFTVYLPVASPTFSYCLLGSVTELGQTDKKEEENPGSLVNTMTVNEVRIIQCLQKRITGSLAMKISI